ncbi:hypothetical protein PybrP1_009729 [[Pythium] brassicae (nom. inval.)]|nr:hypothetical protein PybrP1_009729 [[Pythium] brassicae (nom. inval.)]
MALLLLLFCWRRRGLHAVLVVNVASACGYADQNYRELQALYAKYEARGLEILAFLCNQFGANEPGTPEQILSFVHDTYAVTFLVFAKRNFTKFLVVDGEPFKRYGTSTSPFDLENNIVRALARESSSIGDERQNSEERSTISDAMAVTSSERGYFVAGILTSSANGVAFPLSAVLVSGIFASMARYYTSSSAPETARS